MKEKDQDSDADVSEKGEDIAKDILDNIWKMTGIEKNIQAQNIFKINGKKTIVRISCRGLTIIYKKSFSCFNQKK